MQVNLGVQREVLPGVSVAFDFYRRSLKQQRSTNNLLLDSNDFYPIEVLSPYGDEVITVYDLVDRSLRGQRDNLDTNSSEEFGRRERVYNGYEMTISTRLPGAAPSSGVHDLSGARGRLRQSRHPGPALL